MSGEGGVEEFSEDVFLSGGHYKRGRHFDCSGMGYGR